VQALQTGVEDEVQLPDRYDPEGHADVQFVQTRLDREEHEVVSYWFERQVEQAEHVGVEVWEQVPVRKNSEGQELVHATQIGEVVGVHDPTR